MLISRAAVTEQERPPVGWPETYVNCTVMPFMDWGIKRPFWWIWLKKESTVGSCLHSKSPNSLTSRASDMTIRYRSRESVELEDIRTLLIPSIIGDRVFSTS